MGDIVQSMGAALELVASGTDLRDALEMITEGGFGALICIGDVEHVLEAASGGFRLDTSFTPNRLFELAKMDGAIVLDAHVRRILRANVQLTPAVSCETRETGMRHRTAMRMCVQTDALAVTVSQRRGVIDLYFGGESITLSQTKTGLVQENDTILALRRACDALEGEIERLTGPQRP